MNCLYHGRCRLCTPLSDGLVGCGFDMIVIGIHRAFLHIVTYWCVYMFYVSSPYWWSYVCTDHGGCIRGTFCAHTVTARC